MPKIRKWLMPVSRVRTCAGRLLTEIEIDAATGQAPLMRESINEEKVVAGSSGMNTSQNRSSELNQNSTGRSGSIPSTPNTGSRTPPSSSGSHLTTVYTPSPAVPATPRDQPKPPRRGRAPRGPAPAPRPVHDVDAGRIPVQGENVELLPPNYDPAWGRDRGEEGE